MVIYGGARAAATRRTSVRSLQRNTPLPAHRAIPIALLVMLGACSGIVPEPTQTIELWTSPVSQADCTLSSGQEVYRLATPGAVDVPSRLHRLVVVCSRQGFQDASLVIQSGTPEGALDRFRVSGVSAAEAARVVAGRTEGEPDRIVVHLRRLGPGPASRSQSQSGG
jgi:hypothetical protein